MKISKPNKSEGDYLTMLCTINYMTKMQRMTILLTTVFLFFNSHVICQILSEPDTMQLFENAKYPSGEIAKLMKSKIYYPVEGLKNNIQGDVILEFIIDSIGKIDSVIIQSSPDFALSTSAILAFNYLEDTWNPCKINGEPITKKYQVVIRYRIYLNSEPPVYKKKAYDFFMKQKYESALKNVDKAIKVNPYDYELFEFRSKLKEILGDKENAKIDYTTSLQIKNKIISQFEVAAQVITKFGR